MTTGTKNGSRFKEDSVFGTWFAIIVEGSYCFMCEDYKKFCINTNLLGLTQTVF